MGAKERLGGRSGAQPRLADRTAFLRPSRLTPGTSLSNTRSWAASPSTECRVPSPRGAGLGTVGRTSCGEFRGQRMHADSFGRVPVRQYAMSWGPCEDEHIRMHPTAWVRVTMWINSVPSCGDWCGLGSRCLQYAAPRRFFVIVFLFELLGSVSCTALRLGRPSLAGSIRQLPHSDMIPNLWIVTRASVRHTVNTKLRFALLWKVL